MANLPLLKISNPRNVPRTCTLVSSRQESTVYVRALAASSRAPLPEYTRLPTVMLNSASACASRIAMSFATVAMPRWASAISSGSR